MFLFLLTLLSITYNVHTYKIADKWAKSELSYKIVQYPFSMSKEEVDICIDKAFSIWTRYIYLRFYPSNTNPDIEITFIENDNYSKFSGDYEMYSIALGPSDDGKIYFDDILWTCGPAKSNKINLLSVALHSMGHLIGLDHVLTKNKKSIMFPAYQKDAVDIELDDIYGIRHLYKPKNKQSAVDDTSNRMDRKMRVTTTEKSNIFSALSFALPYNNFAQSLESKLYSSDKSFQDRVAEQKQLFMKHIPNEHRNFYSSFQ